MPKPSFCLPLFVAVVLFWLPSVPFAAESEIWLISTRNAPHVATSATSDAAIQYWKLENNSWQSSGRDDFIASQSPDVPVIFLFHGNWTNHGDVVQMGRHAARSLKNVRSVEKVRLVLWSWPSDRVLAGIRPDVRLKATWADFQAFYVARLLAELPEETRVTLVGFSFGARISLGAVELLADGNIAGRTLAGNGHNSLSQIDLLLCAPAVDQCWVAANGRYRNAMNLADRLWILYNTEDHGLKFYPLIDSIGGPQALGFTGPPIRSIAEENRAKIQAFDMRNVVGSRHAFASYLDSRAFYRCIDDAMAQFPEYAQFP